MQKVFTILLGYGDYEMIEKLDFQQLNTIKRSKQ